MTATVLDATTRAATVAATTQDAQRAAQWAPFGVGDVTVRHMAGAVIAEVSTHGPAVLNSLAPLGATLGALSASTVNVSGATITSHIFVTAGGTAIFSVPASDVTLSAPATLTGRRINLAELILNANPALPLAPTYLLTFDAAETGTVNVDASGSIVNTGTGACAWSITPPTNVTVTPSSGTVAAGATQTLVITATVAATYSLTLVSAGSTITGNPQGMLVNPATATVVTLSVPSSGEAGTAVTVTVTPNGPIPTGGGTVTLAASAGTLGGSTLTFTAGATAAQTTTLTLASAGTASVTMTNDMGLTNSGSPASFSAAAVVGSFASVTLDTTDANAPSATANQVVIVELHGSGTAAPTVGAKYLADMTTGGLGYSTDTTFRFALANGGTIDGRPVCMVRPWDRQGSYPSGDRRESYWMGWTDGPDTGQMRLYTEHRLDRMIEWIEANQANLSATRWALTGGSMGGWGTMTFGIRRPDIFPAIWPDRPRWRSCETTGSVRIPSWAVAVTPAYTFAAAPDLVTDDGGTSTADHMDIIAYVSNTSNPVPWIGWHIGRLDGYMPFQDHIDAVAALRAAGRGFAFYWNNDAHSVNNYRAAEITGSYPMGLFERGKGYPVFSEFSLDDDPAVDLVGGINVGLNFRNVTETTGTWSCEVRYQGTLTRAQQACTVKVKPKSSIYTGDPLPQSVSLPAAAGWATVSF